MSMRLRPRSNDLVAAKVRPAFREIIPCSEVSAFPYRRVPSARTASRLGLIRSIAGLLAVPLRSRFRRLILLGAILVGFGGEPGQKCGGDRAAGDEAVTPVIVRGAHDQHPALPVGIAVHQFRPAHQQLVLRDHGAVESRARGADPFSAFDDRE
jgi:hypothetical protein